MRVVLCDDHRLLLESLASALAFKGCQVEAALTTPTEALRAVALHAPDLLLVDVCFPEGSGLDLARRVRADHPRTKVVMITGEESPDLLREALDIGVSGYIRKGQRVEAIMDVLEAVARGETALDSELLFSVRRAATTATQPRSTIDALTPRELHVLHLLVDGSTTREIVRQLGVSQSTVRTHIQNIFAKLGVHSRLQAAALLAQQSEQVPAGGTDGPE